MEDNLTVMFNAKLEDIDNYNKITEIYDKRNKITS